jgi:hypothetical protein
MQLLVRMSDDEEWKSNIGFSLFFCYKHHLKQDTTNFTTLKRNVTQIQCIN